MQSPSQPDFCVFDPDTLRCGRCGFLARRLPTYRVCRTLHEVAEHVVKNSSESRISIPPIPLGDIVATALSAVGITKERVSRITGKKDCGCKNRQKFLNRIGEDISATVSRAANAVLNATIPHPYTADDVAEVAAVMAGQQTTNPGLVDAAAGGGGDAGES